MVLLQELHGWRELQGLASKIALVSMKIRVLDELKWMVSMGDLGVWRKRDHQGDLDLDRVEVLVLDGGKRERNTPRGMHVS